MYHKSIFFGLGKSVYEVTGVHLCENEKNEKNQHPNPAQQEWVLVDDAINITAYHLQNTPLAPSIISTQNNGQPTRNPQNPQNPRFQ